MCAYSVLTFILVLLFGFMPKLSNKNKMRVKMLTSGIINQIVLLSIIILLMYRKLNSWFISVTSICISSRIKNR